MNGHEAAGDQPDLVAEARFWLEWNTMVAERTHPPVEAAAIAASISPDPDRIAALLARAQTASALTHPAPTTSSGGDLIQVHADAGRFFQSRLDRSWVPAYLAERGLDAALLPTSPWKIGYAPGSWTALTTHLRALGYTDEILLRSGLVAEGRNGRLRDRFRNRLMIPLRRASDRAVVAFTGRRLPGAGDDHGPKYLNSPNTELYVKGHILAGLAEGRRPLESGAQPVLVEGPMDAIAVSIAAPGRYAGVTPCGTALTAEQATALARAADLSEHGIRVALDPDRAGRKAAIEAYARLAQVTGHTTAVTLPDGLDPAGMLEKQGRQQLRNALTSSTRPLAALVVDARIQAWEHDGELDSVETQFAAIRAAAKTIATMPLNDAATQATRVAALFITRYHWHPGEATRELVEAVERYRPAPRKPEPPAARDRTVSLPPQTTTALANATAPHTTHAATPTRAPSPPGSQIRALRQQARRPERD
ncbi:MAG: toprim domain-containing protein [Nocardiopsaceae bacterium]|nr:toprim domain-containing protein [Nocardiopsaceae bacterium]